MESSKSHRSMPGTAAIRVKLQSPVPRKYFMHQFPGGQPVWGNCHYSFEPDDREYDWLVVYEDLPGLPGMPRNERFETVACPAEHTMLTTSEPSSIKHYGNPYTRQFGCVLTSQAEWALPHSDRIFSQAGLIWMYGIGSSHERTFDEMADNPPANKMHDVSMVFSPKRQRHTLHHNRNTFMRKLKDLLPEMAVYGRGVLPLDDKADALDPYRYHVAIENYIGPHHWTEKLADSFLGLTLPFYCGCTNVDNYFPADSYIPIDVHDPQGAAQIIRAAVANDEYRQRLPAIMEARRRVLHEYNYFALVSREIEKRHVPERTPASPVRVYSRHALRRQSMANRLEDLYGKARARILHRTGRI